MSRTMADKGAMDMTPDRFGALLRWICKASEEKGLREKGKVEV